MPTHESKHTCVYTHMITQVATCAKHLATHFTAEFKALVTHMDNRMLLQKAGTRERLTADFAVVNRTVWWVLLLYNKKMVQKTTATVVEI